MRKIATALALATGLSLTAGAIATPALADVDFRFGINLGPPAYYYGPRPYYYNPYYHPYGPYYYRHYW
jgi:hypothetical protein